MALTSNEIAILIKCRDQTSGPMKDIEKNAGSLGKTLSTGLKVGVLAGAAGLAALGTGLASCVKDAMEAQKVMTQTEAVLASTGGVSGMTAKSVSDLANSLSKVIPIDDELIQSTENMLLTFTNVGKNIFPQATEAALNMATALGGDPVDAAMKLGKALNDPIAGVTALRKVGVMLTDQQKDQIKAMVEAGDVAGAQAVILKELETEFGNSGRAAGQTMGGQMKILQTQIGNVKEAIGIALLPILTKAGAALSGFLVDHIDDIETFVQKVSDLGSKGFAAALPYIKNFGEVLQTKVIPFLKDAIPWFIDLGKTMLEMGQNIATFLAPALDTLADLWANVLGPALEVVMPYLQKIGKFLSEHKELIIAVAAVIILMVNPWLAVAAAILIVLTKWDEISAFFTNVAKAVDSFIDKMGEIPIIGEIFKATWNDIVVLTTAAWDIIKVYVETAINVVKDTIKIVTALIHGDWGEAWNGIKQLFTDVWAGIIGLVGVYLDTVKGLFVDKLELVKGIWGDAWKGLLQGANLLATQIEAFLNTALGALFTLPSRALGIGSDIVTALWNGIQSLRGWLMDKLGDFVGDIVGKLDPRNWDIPGLSPFVQAYGHVGQMAGTAMVTGMRDALSGAGGAVGTMLSGVGGAAMPDAAYVDQFIGPWMATIRKIFDQGGADAAGDFTKKLIAMLGTENPKATTAIREFYGLLCGQSSEEGAKAGAGGATALTSSLVDDIEAAESAVGNDVANSLRSAMASFAGEALNWGKSIAEYIMSGIYTGFADNFMGYAGDIAAIINDNLRTALGSGGGAGGISGYQHGGLVRHTGLAFVHAGETVVPAGGSSGGTVINVNLEITGPILGDRRQLEEIASRLEPVLRRRMG